MSKFHIKLPGLALSTLGLPARCSRIGTLLLLLAVLLLGVASSARAAGDMCSDYPGGVIDGSVLNINQLPSTLGIDRDCTIKNFPKSMGGLPFTLINFQFPQHASYLIIFDNVYYKGNMSCNDPTQSTFSMWWSNGSYNNISSSCQQFVIPVDGIHKENPAGQTTATIGVPFTYTLTFPDMATLTSSGYVYSGTPDTADVNNIRVTDDLTATGASLTYLSNTLYLKNSDGTTTSLGPLTNSGDSKHLTFSYADNPVLAKIPANAQIVLKLTVVLDNVPANAPGTQFVNTAHWELGRIINGTEYEPLPGQDGVTPPMTIVGPNLVVNKTSSETALNFGVPSTFAIDVQNTGGSDAWDATILDQLPGGPNGGMCDYDPTTAPGGVTAEITGADGSLVSKLTQGTDFAVNYSGAPTCQLSLSLQDTPAAKVGPSQHLVIHYQSQLDADSKDGVTLTNVAGATRWFNGNSSLAGRHQYDEGPLTDGTPGIADFQDSTTVTTALSGYYFQKTVEDLNTGANPATTAAPGDRLRYRVRLFNVDQKIDAINIRDVLDPSRFDLSTFTLVSPLPAGAKYSFDPATGLLEISGDTAPLNVAVGGELVVEFEITLKSTLANGTAVDNQASLSAAGLTAKSDDPYVNGIAPPGTPADPTRVVIDSPGPLAKANTQASATIGGQFKYRITVPATPINVPLYDVRILDNLGLSAANMRFVSARVVSGGSWSLSNAGSATDLILEDPATGIDIPAGGQAVIEITTELQNTATNQKGLAFKNSASYTYNRLNGDEATRKAGGAGTTLAMNVVEPQLSASKTVRYVTPTGKAITEPAATGDVLEYALTVTNGGNSTAFDTNVVDTLPPNLALVAGSATARINGVPVTGFIANPTPLTGGAVAWGRQNADESLDIPAGQSLVLTYRATVGLVTGTDLKNSAYVDWTSLDGTSADERTGAGCPNVTAPNTYCTGPATTTLSSVLAISFVKSVVNVTTGEDPGANAKPGDTLRYTISLANKSLAPLDNATLVDDLAAQFVPGSLRLVSFPAGADTTATNPTGGANGTGVVELRNLNLAAQGSPGDSLTVVFEAKLAPVIQSGTAVLNQAQLTLDNQVSATSNQTSTLITSAPAFQVWKTSTVLGANPVLMAGGTLRYTLTMKNVGSEDAVHAKLRDYVPANTTYVANSTTLNGAAVPDPSAGVSPLQAGMLVNAPGDPTAGELRADTSARANNVATVTFDVKVDPGVMDGLVIENQGFLESSGAGSGPQPDRPSDDPATPTPLDPTRNVVGNLPLLNAQKTVQIEQDLGSAGVVDPGDVLRYTIRIDNFGAATATGVVLTDAVPANTTYVADSLRLNGAALAPDGGVSPLIAGLAVQSSAGGAAGTLAVGASAVVTFDVKVNAGVAAGTVISNQGSVASKELPPELTDADGLPANGYQPTVVVVGDAQLLSLTKQVSVVGGGIAAPGSQLEYIIRATNAASLPATQTVVTDDLAPLANQVTYVAGSGTLNGSAAGVSFSGSVLTADYASIFGNLQPGAVAVVRFRVQINPAVALGTTLTNTALVRWNDPAQSASASVSLDVGGTPGSASLNGSVWHDANLDKLYDGAEQRLAGWRVELYTGNHLQASTVTDDNGAYRLGGLVPNAGGTAPYELRFRAPGAGPKTPSLGDADSPFTNGPQRISGITVASGSNLQGLNLPITPNGVVYNSVQRTPVAGASVAMLNAATHEPLPSQCFDDPAQQNQVTAANGFYKFDLNFSDPSCPAGGAYFIKVTPPGSGYAATPSRIIPPNGAATDPFSVPACPGSAADAVPGTAEYCEVSASASPPPLSAAPGTAGTTYHLYLTLSNGFVPGQSQIFNNHIPVDPVLNGAVAITKTSSLLNVTKGQLVPYTITVSNLLGAPLYDIGIVDSPPAGFKYVKGSARLDGEAREPRISGRELVWNGLDLQVNAKHTLQLLLVVGAGVSEGEYVNRAQVIDSATGGSVSGEASASVRIIPDPTLDCTDVIGKVFDDRNLNGQQDPGEEGLAGVSVVTVRGLIATTDKQGRYHITCAMVPDPDRGSNFILKLDDRTLPTGFRLTTENPRVERATRGKMLKVNFGATIHHVIGLDVSDGVFEPDKSRLRVQWVPKLERLMEELKKGPSVLRLSYLADVERQGLVRKRLEALKKAISRRWERSGGGYQLTIETEVFWRRGGPQ